MTKLAIITQLEAYHAYIAGDLEEAIRLSKEAAKQLEDGAAKAALQARIREWERAAS